MRSIAISAGEASGDLYGAHLVRELRRINSQLQFWGTGGCRLREAGVDIRFDTTDGGTIGIWATMKTLPQIARGYIRFRQMLLRERPALFLPIDFGAFNLRLAQVAARKGISVVYFIPPDSWRRRPRNAAKLKAAGGKVISPFRWSAEYLSQQGVDARWVGHPLVDLAKPSAEKSRLRQEFGLSDSAPVIGLLPGSRKHELVEHLPPMVSCSQIVSRELPGTQFVMPFGTASPWVRGRVIAALGNTERNIDVRIVEDRTYDCMAACDILICKSGTATLEASLIGTPMVIVYRGTLLMRLEYRLRKNEIDQFIGLPNLIAGREICPEFLNEEVTGENLAEVALNLLRDNNLYEQQRQSLARLRSELGEPGAIARAAEAILEMGGLAQ